MGGLQALAAENAKLEARAGVEPGCTVIGAASEADLEEIVDRLKRDFDVNASLGRVEVAYPEALTRSADGNAARIRRAAAS